MTHSDYGMVVTCMEPCDSSLPPPPPLPSLSSPPLISQGTPKHINFEEVKEDLEKIDGVKQAHSLHIWSLTLNKIALAAHLVLGEGQVFALE